MSAAIKLHRHVGRKRAARFLAEGSNLVEAASRRGFVAEVFVTESALHRFASILDDMPTYLVTEKAANALSDTVTPVGLVAVCELPESDLSGMLESEPRLVAVAVEISEPGNAGTLIRLADAMGADAVILAGNSVDPYNGKCLRASAGSIFALPVISAPDAAAVIDRLSEAGLQVLATTLNGEIDLDAVNLTGPTAWVFGPESHGLSADLAAAADSRVRIPMRGGAESLNVAAAAAICLYESSRQQR